jgi:flavin reductase (DIM6/NTAB) family NADH-FMN oxidoreductase RutF
MSYNDDTLSYAVKVLIMNEPSFATKAPVAWRPAGLISWYAPDGKPLVLVTSWIALVGGALPRLRTAWCGRFDSDSCYWQAGDFILNVPHDSDLETISRIMGKGKFCLLAEEELAYSCLPGVAATAPRLLECAVQIECVGGCLIETGFDAELCGDVARVHRDGVNLDPLEIPDICAIYPLRP